MSKVLNSEQTNIRSKDTQLVNDQARIQKKAIRHDNPHSWELLLRPISHMHLHIQYFEGKNMGV